MSMAYWIFDVIITFIFLDLVHIYNRKKYEKKLKMIEKKYSPIGSVIAHDQGYLYIQLDSHEAQELLFNSDDGDTVTFRFIDVRAKNN